METFSALPTICAGFPVSSPHKGQWRGALMFSLSCVWINGWVNNRETGDLRRYRAHYDVMYCDDYSAAVWWSYGWCAVYSKAVFFISHAKTENTHTAWRITSHAWYTARCSLCTSPMLCYHLFCYSFLLRRTGLSFKAMVGIFCSPPLWITCNSIFEIKSLWCSVDQADHKSQRCTL